MQSASSATTAAGVAGGDTIDSGSEESNDEKSKGDQRGGGLRRRYKKSLFECDDSDSNTSGGSVSRTIRCLGKDKCRVIVVPTFVPTASLPVMVNATKAVGVRGRVRPVEQMTVIAV